jgi:uncharacterized protein (TIGR03084 family)
VSELDDVREDLRDEQQWLDGVVGGLDDERWRAATPAAGWNVRDQIAHLAYFDDAAAVAVAEPARFVASRDELLAAALEKGLDDATLAPLRALASHALLARWRAARDRLSEAAASLEPGDRVEWYGPSMGAVSFLAARLMESWAHGVDVTDALRAPRQASERLRHVARLGYRTRAWSYRVRGEAPPERDVRVALQSPSGREWSWGPGDAGDAVRGPAEDFCLVVTQRRHLDDTALRTGELGRHWLVRAQAFAGAPTTGPEPRSRDATR